MRRRASVGFVVAAVGLLTACGDDDDAGAEVTELEDIVVIEDAEVDVAALDNSFNDQNIQVAPGTKVVWENKGRVDHDIVPADDAAGEGWGIERTDFGPGDVYERTFDEPGTYRYYCSLHGTADAGMIGAVVVEGDDSNP